MITAVSNFIEFLKEHKVFYRYEKVDNETEMIEISYKGKKIESITVNFFFGADGKDVNMHCFSLCKAPKEKYIEVLEKLNRFNIEFRWVKFFIDAEETEVSASADAIISDSTAAEVCFEYFIRIHILIEEIYEDLMRTIWSSS
jgi:hypothetical protein